MKQPANLRTATKAGFLVARVLVAAHIQGVMPLLRSRRLDRRPDCFATSGHACLCHSPNVSGRPLNSLLADVTWRSCLSDSPFQRIFSGSNELDRLPVIACPSLFARRRSLAPSDQPRGIACLSAFHEIHKKTREKRAVYRSLKLKQAAQFIRAVRDHLLPVRATVSGKFRALQTAVGALFRGASWAAVYSYDKGGDYD